jgi:hypothetical protein
MKRYHVVLGAVLMAGLIAGGFSQTYAQQETTSPAASQASSIKFVTPASFQCGAKVSWSTLSAWKGESGKCGAEGALYTVVGEVPTVAEGYIEGKLIVPEIKDKEYEAYEGAKHNIVKHRFEVAFCITTREADRPIKIQAYNNDKQAQGPLCEVTLTK